MCQPFWIDTEDDDIVIYSDIDSRKSPQKGLVGVLHQKGWLGMGEGSHKWITIHRFSYFLVAQYLFLKEKLQCYKDVHVDSSQQRYLLMKGIAEKTYLGLYLDS